MESSAGNLDKQALSSATKSWGVLSITSYHVFSDVSSSIAEKAAGAAFGMKLYLELSWAEVLSFLRSLCLVPSWPGALSFNNVVAGRGSHLKRAV